MLLIFKDIKKNVDGKKVILFSPSAASFDQFKNFEDRGKYFNKIIKNYIKKYRVIGWTIILTTFMTGVKILINIF